MVSNAIFRGNLFHVWLCVTNHKFASIPSFKYANLNSFWLGNLMLSFYQIFTFVSIKCSNKISIYGAWYLVSRLLWLCSVQKNIFIFVTKLLGAITAIFGALIYWIQFKYLSNTYFNHKASDDLLTKWYVSSTSHLKMNSNFFLASLHLK